jgi:hypothetical protein
MGIYNFKPQFEPYILDWSKRHTIRGERQHPDRPGSVMHLFVGLRHQGARNLMRPMCTRTEFIRIEGGKQTPFRILMGLSVGLSEPGVIPAASATPFYGTETGGPLVRLVIDEANDLAWRDGFRPVGSTVDDPGDALGLMMRFWEGRLPFEGTVNHWNPAKQAIRDPWVKKRWRWAEQKRGASC